MKTRRLFLGELLSAGAATGLAGTLALAQNRNPIPPTVTGGTPLPPDSSQPSAEKHLMEENEKELHKKVERLYELATELKAEADKTDSTKVLSLNLVKKAEEIEKLAHDIKIRSKG
ncbi:MAG: hypothetical protein ACHQT6_07960 [Candidatus Acidiferrales bacterium]